MASKVRVLGLDDEGLADFRTQTTRNSGLYRALDRRVEVVGAVTPKVPLWQRRSIELLRIARDREHWRRRAGLAPMAFRARTRAAERELAARARKFDVILQLYCVFAPGRLNAGRRYAMYLDATAMLTRREFPEGIPLSPRAFEHWLTLERPVYESAERLFSMSDWVKDSLIADYGIDPAKIVVAGAGANLMAHELDGRRWDQRVALFVGLDWKRKGGPILLEAWPEVRRELPDAQLWMVGTRRAYAPAQDGVRWFGRVPPKVVAELYAKANVFVLPSLFDPFPHVLREAMGHGLACVATATGGTAEIVRAGEDGLLVPARDSRSLAGALTALLADPPGAEAMGRAGHARMLGEVTWDGVAARIAPHLEAIARG